MKRITAILLIGLLHLPLVLTANGQPPPTAITGFSWTGAQYSGFDPFYTVSPFGGVSVKAFRTGSTASLSLAVANPLDTAINVSAVKVSLDWGKNYSLTLSPPTQIGKGSSASFTVTFTVPATSEATNLVTHSYELIVEYSTTPGGPTSAFMLPDPSNPFATQLIPFVIYSTDQADDMALLNRLGLPGFAGVQTTQLCGFQFKTAEAASLCLQSSREAVAGLNLYTTGDFSGAKTRLQRANDLIDQAISTDSSRGSSTELASTLGNWGGLLLGIGAIVGVIVYSMKSRRRTTPTPAMGPPVAPS